jgi:AraC-like DNA-binding protein
MTIIRAAKGFAEVVHPALFTHAPVTCTTCEVALGWVRPAVLPPAVSLRPIVGLSGPGAQGTLRLRLAKGKWRELKFDGERILLLPEQVQFSLQWHKAAPLVLVSPSEHMLSYFRDRIRTPALMDLRRFTLFHPSAAGMWRACLRETERLGVPREETVGPLGQLVGLEILELVARGTIRTDAKAWRLERSALAKVLAFIREHYWEDLSIKDLAKAAGGFSASYFGQAFKAVTGFKPMDYVMGVRIAEAQKRLETTDDSIAEIAAACGFGNQSHMVARFKLAYGVAPKTFRLGCARFAGKIEKRRKPVQWRFE